MEIAPEDEPFRMRIVYDHQVFSLQNSGGISSYYFELASHLSRGAFADVDVFLGLNRCIYPFRGLEHPCAHILGWSTKLRPGLARYALNELVTGAWSVTGGRWDIYHNTLYRFMPTVRARRFVATHHDCVQERFPKLFPDHARIIGAKRRMFQKADLVLCVSESSRADLEHFYGVEPSRCKVIYNGVSPMVRSEAGKTDLLRKVRRPFLLYVGIRAEYKNFRGFLSAFTEAGLHADYDILTLGGGSFSDDELRFIRGCSLQDAVISVPTASPDLLAEAYSMARLLVYPSLYEGFGFPPLEAMLLGTPALVAASPATLEVCGDAAFFFDPSDQEEFVIKLKSALEDEAARHEKIAIGLKFAQRYQWDRAVAQVLAAYQSIL
jgi:glycosyltransferase involved in cell wall biosynthesis